MDNQRNVLIVGGGIISFAIALELQALGLRVTILCRDSAEAATHAAAGMLAPQAEEIPPSPMLDLCLLSRSRYPDWIRKLETLTGMDAGYWDCGIVAPRYSSVGLARSHLDAVQPGLGAEVSGGYWFPQDAQVDNRSLFQVLWMAAAELGVEVQTGVNVDAIAHNSEAVTHLQTNQGVWSANHYILATGAWSQALLPIPVLPRKGQMLSVQSPAGLPLQHVLFGEESYIVPRRDGRIVIGATSENVGFTPGNTPQGMQTLLAEAIRLFPPLQNLPIQKFWWGYRPATPDECPILGTSPYKNLTLATGHYRNGILLAPITGELIAKLVAQDKVDPLLDAFHWSRFN
jgi:glycine/D-amino acid oxidase-like deaminating enzyme